MSAFMCTPETIAKLASYLFHNFRSITHEGVYCFQIDKDTEYHSVDDLYDAMWILNKNSLINRYGKDIDNMVGDYIPFKFVLYQPIQSDPEFVKLADCYDYQSCEGDNYNHPLLKVIKHYVYEVAMNYIRSQPEYEDALWE